MIVTRVASESGAQSYSGSLASGPITHIARRATGPCPAFVPSLTTTVSPRVVATPAINLIHQAPCMPKATVAPTLSRTPSSVMPPVVRLRLWELLSSFNSVDLPSSPAKQPMESLKRFGEVGRPSS